MTIIHVNLHTIRKNNKTGERNPPIAIRKAKNCQIKFEGETYKIPEELYEYVKESEGIPEPECFAYVLDEDGDCDGYVGFV